MAEAARAERRAAALSQAAAALASGDAAAAQAAGLQGEGGEARVRQKRMRCGECAACAAPNCGVCRFCLDMPKFGGVGTLRQPCLQRRCSNKTFDAPPSAAPRPNTPAAPPPQPDVYDESLVGRRVRALRGATWRGGTIVQFQPPVTRSGAPRFLVRLDGGGEGGEEEEAAGGGGEGGEEEEAAGGLVEVSLPDNPHCHLLPRSVEATRRPAKASQP